MCMSDEFSSTLVKKVSLALTFILISNILYSFRVFYMSIGYSK
jgi:hypothetical protein